MAWREDAFTEKADCQKAGRKETAGEAMNARSRTKYHNKPVSVDGVRFDSKAEARRWVELGLLVKAGHIWDLQRQVRFPLYVLQTRIGVYVADFVYTTTEDGKAISPVTGVWPGLTGGAVVEDVKGVRTALYKWKAKHFAAQYGRPITEVKA